MIDSEKVIKHLITQYCDQQFKFTINLKILGSIHVIVDNNEVLTCLLDEKYFKPNANRGLIIPNNSFNPSSHLPIPQNQSLNTDHALNLVSTLTQLQQQQRCTSKMSVSTASKSSSKSSTSSHSSSSSASSSSSSYISSVLNDQSNQDPMHTLQQTNGTSKHKRKRFTPKSNNGKGINDETASTGSSKSSKKDTENNTDNDNDDVSDDEVNTNNENVSGSHVSSSLTTNLQRMTTNDTQNTDEMDDMQVNDGIDSLNASHMDQTPVKRNKLDTGYETPVDSVNSNSNPTTYSNPTSNSASSIVSDAEAAAAAAATLSLISVASKLNSNSQTNMPQMNQQDNIAMEPKMNNNTSNVQNFKNKKSKIKSIIEEYNKNEQFQLQLQQQEQARANAMSNTGSMNTMVNGIDNNYDQENNIPGNNNTNDNHNESSSSEDQLYMDEGADDMNNGNGDPNSVTTGPSTTESSSAPVQDQQRQQQQNQQQQQQHHHQLMMAAAAAIINNNNAAQNGSATDANKIFMPQLALNLAVAKQQQQQQQQNVVIPKKKKQRQNSMMSPSSSTSSSSVASSSNTTKSTTSNSSSSSTSSGSSKGGKNKRQTVAALAAAANAQNNLSQNGSVPQNELQRNLAALAQQFGLKDSNNFDQIIQDMNVNNEKSKLLLTHTPQPSAPIKFSKKHHLLAARSANNSPSIPTTKAQRNKTKKSQFQDTSNLPQTQNPVAQAAAAAALRYQQLLNQVNNPNNTAGSYNNTPSKNMYQNGYDMEDENQREQQYECDENEEAENNYDEQDDNNPNLKNLAMQGNIGTAGSINFKSLNTVAGNKQEPLTQSNNQSNVSLAPNLEFECTACDKKFKYYCYYKRHMDACHSDNPKYVCDTCNKSYKWEASFRQHLRSHHVNNDSNKNESENENIAAKNVNLHKSDVYQNLKMSFQNNENREYNDENAVKTEDISDNDEYNDDADSQDIESQINHSQNEASHQNMNYMMKTERDTEQMGAAGALASIADSINNMIQSNPLATSN